MVDNTLIIDDLHVNVAGREILKGLDLEVKQGEIHALLGPNGSGKSTLAYTIAGHPKYEVTQGRILWQGEDVLAMSPDERAKRGLFLAFQYPTATPSGASKRRSSSSTGRPSSRPTTTSSRPSTRPSGRAARSSGCRRVCTSRSRCRPTSGSTSRTWASSSGR